MLFPKVYYEGKKENKRITAIAIAILVLLSISVQIPYLKAQNNLLLVNNHSILWAITNASKIRSQFNVFVIAFSHNSLKAMFSISSQLGSSIPESNITINIIGSERIHYLFTSSITNTIREYFEGNIVIDKKDIIVQWHKHEITMLGKFNETHTWILLRQQLMNLLNNNSINPGKVLTDANGIYVAEATQNKFRSIYYLLDIYVNKSRYLGNVPNCDVIDALPMRTDISMGIKASKNGYTYAISIDGSVPNDILNGYKAMLCMLPLLTKLQDIIKYLEANVTQVSIHRLGIANVFLESVTPFFLNAIANTLVSGYVHIFSIPLIRGNVDIVIVSLYNYSSSRIALAITNINSTKNIRYAELMCNLSNYMINPFINQNICKEIGNAITIVKHLNVSTQTFTQPMQNTLQGLQNTFLMLFMLIIGIVAVETGVVIYMVFKILKYKKA